MIKALFFDIDGTLVSFNTHSIPQSTVTALEAARSTGIEIYISTGRPFPLIDNIGAIGHLIDGYITANGAYCFSGDTMISCSPIDRTIVDNILSQSDRHGFACMVVGQQDLTLYNPDQRARRIFSELLNVSDIGGGISTDKVLSQPILQLTPVISVDQEASILPKGGNFITGRWCQEFVDITAGGVDKAKGLRDIAQWRGIDLSHTMAFGDGGNDIAILKAAGIGVAMGNANQSLKQVADHITSTVDDNGISAALHHFGII